MRPARVTREPSWCITPGLPPAATAACVEWAPEHAPTSVPVPVRDSKNPGGPVLAVPTNAFASFVAGVKAGEFGTA
ncbi:DUF397 domain-containing protein [Streptomyces sp. NPDC014734]|uniref:DUF397 domain-containing protein n=1 Tax=Streptomyces sp. NPDC014734 TaxID=3364886 RepID=UPI0037024623